MTSLDDAKHAKETLKSRLGARPWLKGIGIARGRSGFCVQVNVSRITNDVRAAIPKELEGVEVRLEEVGHIVPLAPPAKSGRAPAKRAARRG